MLRVWVVNQRSTVTVVIAIRCVCVFVGMCCCFFDQETFLTLLQSMQLLNGGPSVNWEC